MVADILVKVLYGVVSGAAYNLASYVTQVKDPKKPASYDMGKLFYSLVIGGLAGVVADFLGLDIESVIGILTAGIGSTFVLDKVVKTGVRKTGIKKDFQM